MKFLRFLRITFIAIALSFMVGCSTQEREIATFAKLKNGMSETQLSDLLGKPTKVENNSDFVIWTYPAGLVFLKDGKVYSWKDAEYRP